MILDRRSNLRPLYLFTPTVEAKIPDCEDSGATLSSCLRHASTFRSSTDRSSNSIDSYIQSFSNSHEVCALVRAFRSASGNVTISGRLNRLRLELKVLQYVVPQGLPAQLHRRLAWLVVIVVQQGSVVDPYTTFTENFSDEVDIL